MELVTLNTLRTQLRTMLMPLVNDDEVLPINGTLKFMTTSVKQPPREMLEACAEAMKAMGEDITADELQIIHRLDAEQSRAALAAMSSRVLDVALSVPTADEETYVFDQLAVSTQRSLLQKLYDAMNMARNKVFQGMLRGSGKADLGDLPLIRSCINHVKDALESFNAEPEQESAPNAPTVTAEQAEMKVKKDKQKNVRRVTAAEAAAQ